MATTKTTKAPAKKAKTETFSADEKAAMRAAAKEAKKGKANGLDDLLAAINAMPSSEKSIAQKLHKIVSEVAPGLKPKTWYGMPAWADDNGKAVCFFQPASKFKARYSTLGFNDSARLDDGEMWATSFGINKIGDTEEKKIAALVKKALG
jgi:uncharacterized protein YdhG (YjbR/CyaY superfamily)